VPPGSQQEMPVLERADFLQLREKRFRHCAPLSTHRRTV
jgi:hypothetical protein